MDAERFYHQVVSHHVLVQVVCTWHCEDEEEKETETGYFSIYLILTWLFVCCCVYLYAWEIIIAFSFIHVMRGTIGSWSDPDYYDSWTEGDWLRLCFLQSDSELACTVLQSVWLSQSQIIRSSYCTWLSHCWLAWYCTISLALPLVFSLSVMGTWLSTGLFTSSAHGRCGTCLLGCLHGTLGRPGTCFLCCFLKIPSWLSEQTTTSIHCLLHLGVSQCWKGDLHLRKLLVSA